MSAITPPIIFFKEIERLGRPPIADKLAERIRAASVVIDATKGAFRFSTGAQNKGDYKVKTPFGTLGVRG